MADLPRVHVHVAVSNLEKSREFYEKFLGVPPVKVRPGYAKFLPAFGPLNLAISERAAGSAQGPVHHLGIQVESREIVERELRRVREAGLPVHEEFGVDCCHANQDKFWVRDPDGVEWEVYVLNRDLEDGPACGTGRSHLARPGLAVVSTSSCCGSA